MALESTQRTRLATVAILTLVFGTGVLMGLVIDRGLTAAPVPTATVTDSASADEGPRYMFERVGLSAQQRAVVDTLVAAHRERMSALRKRFSEEYDPQYRAIVVSTREAIKDVMTSEQAAMYDSLTTARDEFRADSIARAEAQSGG